MHRRALEELRTTPARPWTRDAGRVALLQGGVALVVAATLGTRNWSSPLANHLALGLVGALLLALATVGSVLALAPGRRRPRLLLWLVPCPFK